MLSSSQRRDVALIYRGENGCVEERQTTGPRSLLHTRDLPGEAAGKLTVHKLGAYGYPVFYEESAEESDDVGRITLQSGEETLQLLKSSPK